MTGCPGSPASDVARRMVVPSKACSASSRSCGRRSGMSGKSTISAAAPRARAQAAPVRKEAAMWLAYIAILGTRNVGGVCRTHHEAPQIGPWLGVDDSQSPGWWVSQTAPNPCHSSALRRSTTATSDGSEVYVAEGDCTCTIRWEYLCTHNANRLGSCHRTLSECGFLQVWSLNWVGPRTPLFRLCNYINYRREQDASRTLSSSAPRSTVRHMCVSREEQWP